MPGPFGRDTGITETLWSFLRWLGFAVDITGSQQAAYTVGTSQDLPIFWSHLPGKVLIAMAAYTSNMPQSQVGPSKYSKIVQGLPHGPLVWAPAFLLQVVHNCATRRFNDSKTWAHGPMLRTIGFTLDIEPLRILYALQLLQGLWGLSFRIWAWTVQKH